jgi:hypothetical protein
VNRQARGPQPEPDRSPAAEDIAEGRAGRAFLIGLGVWLVGGLTILVLLSL